MLAPDWCRCGLCSDGDVLALQIGSLVGLNPGSNESDRLDQGPSIRVDFDATGGGAMIGLLLVRS